MATTTTKRPLCRIEDHRFVKSAFDPRYEVCRKCDLSRKLGEEIPPKLLSARDRAALERNEEERKSRERGEAAARRRVQLEAANKLAVMADGLEQKLGDLKPKARATQERLVRALYLVSAGLRSEKLPPTLAAYTSKFAIDYLLRHEELPDEIKPSVYNVFGSKKLDGEKYRQARADLLMLLGEPSSSPAPAVPVTVSPVPAMIEPAPVPDPAISLSLSDLDPDALANLEAVMAAAVADPAGDTEDE